MSAGDHDAVTVNDLIVTTNKGLYCEECVKEYRSELSIKVKSIESLMSLYEDLHPKSDLDPDATIDQF